MALRIKKSFSTCAIGCFVRRTKVKKKINKIKQIEKSASSNWCP